MGIMLGVIAGLLVWLIVMLDHRLVDLTNVIGAARKFEGTVKLPWVK